MNSPDDNDNHPNHRHHQHRSIHPPFPEPGSTIGPDDKFFCLGRLGKGTFCAIHKCVDLSYSHHQQHQHRSSSSSSLPPTTAVVSSSSSQLTQSPTPVTADADTTATGGDDSKSMLNISSTSRKQRIVAAKVELANFVDSGVIDGEASVLKFLDVSLPDGMVPIFVDYVRQPPPSTTTATLATTSSGSSAEATVVTPGTTIMEKSSSAGTSADGGLSAIIMEHLPGEDMHLLRDRHCQTLLLEKSETGLSSSSTNGGGAGTGEKVPRRLSIQDSVYLVAEVMLPLLKALHEVGIVHRDVKPSVRFVNGVSLDRASSDPSFSH